VDEERWHNIEKWVIAIVAIAMLSLAMYFGLQQRGESEKVSDLQAKIAILEADRGQKQLNIDAYKKKITGLNQEVEQLTIKYMADKMYIEELESEYKIVLTYATVAESLLRAAGIDYTILQGIEDEEKN